MRREENSRYPAVLLSSGNRVRQYAFNSESIRAWATGPTQYLRGCKDPLMHFLPSLRGYFVPVVQKYMPLLSLKDSNNNFPTSRNHPVVETSYAASQQLATIQFSESDSEVRSEGISKKWVRIRSKHVPEMLLKAF